MTITLEDFQKVEIRVGKILSAEKIPDTDKLLKLMVDVGLKPKPTAGMGSPLGRLVGYGLAEHSVEQNVLRRERDIRQIVSGIALHFPEPSVLVGKRCMFVTNLAPRVIRGFESNGMLFAVSTEDGKFSLLEPSSDIPPGTRAK